jgi:hypothetical protein
LPDGLFFKPKIPICAIYGGTWNGKCRYILWPLAILYTYSKIFGIFYGNLVYYSSFGMLHHEKSGNPVLNALVLQMSCWVDNVAFHCRRICVSLFTKLIACLLVKVKRFIMCPGGNKRLGFTNI